LFVAGALLLPDAARVACRVPGHRHPHVTFGVGRQAYLAPGAGDLGKGLVDVLHVDVRDDASRSVAKWPMMLPVVSPKRLAPSWVFQPNTVR